MTQSSIVTVNISIIFVKEPQDTDTFHASLICDSKISSTNIIKSSTPGEIDFNQSLSLLTSLSDDSFKKGALVLAGEFGPDQSCLGFGEIVLSEVEDCNAVLYDKNGPVGNVQYSIIVEPCDQYIESDDVSSEWNLVEQVSLFYELDPTFSTSNSSIHNSYAPLLQLLHKSNQNQRVLADRREAETGTLLKERGELARYKALVETLEARESAASEAVTRLQAGSLRDQRLITQLSSSQDASSHVQALQQSRTDMQGNIDQLSTALAEEREVTRSLRAELASLPSKEQLFQTSADLSFTRARATELHCAMDVVLQYMQVSTGASSGPDASAVAQALESALVAGLRGELESAAQRQVQLTFQRDSLEKNNRVLSQQVLALLAQLGQSPKEFPISSEFPVDELVVKEINAGSVQALAGPTVAAQFATIAELERSLAHFKQVAAHQAARLETLEVAARHIGAAATTGEQQQPMTLSGEKEEEYESTISELEAQLEEAKNLASLYYEKLQAGSEFLKQQRVQQEQTAAELDAAQNEVLSLQQQLADALVKSMDQETDQDQDDEGKSSPKKSQREVEDDSEEVQELNSIIEDLETQLEETKNLANLYYEKLQAGADYIKQQKTAHEAAEAQLVDAQNELARLREQNAGADQSEMAAQLAEATAELALLKEQVAHANHSQLEAQLAEANTELTSLREQVAGADQSKMEALSVAAAGEAASRRRVKVLERDLETAQAKLAELESQLAALQESEAVAAAVPSLSAAAPLATNESSALIQEKEETIAQLTADLEEAESQLEEMSTTLETYYARLQAGADYTKVLRADLEAVTVERDALRVAESQKSVDNGSGARLLQVTADLAKATDQIDQLTNDVSVYESRMQQNDKQVSDLRAEISSLQSERSELLARLEMLQSADTPIAVTDNSGEVEALKSEITALQARLSDLGSNESSKALQRKLDSLEQGYAEECASKDETIEQLTADLDAAESKLEELSDTMNQYYSRLKDGAEHSKRAAEEAKLVQAERDALAVQVAKLQDEISDLKTAVAAAPAPTPTDSVDKEALSKLAAQILLLENKRKSSTQEVKALQMDNVSLKKQVSDLEAEIDALKASIDPFAIPESTDNDQVAKLSAQISALESEKDVFESQLKKLRDDNVGMQKQVALLTAELEAAKASAESASADSRIIQAHSSNGDIEQATSAKSTTDVDSMLSDLIEAKMALAHTALELEDERQKSKQLRSQLDKLNRQGDVVEPTKKKNFFG